MKVRVGKESLMVRDKDVHMAGRAIFGCIQCDAMKKKIKMSFKAIKPFSPCCNLHMYTYDTVGISVPVTILMHRLDFNPCSFKLDFQANQSQ